MPSSSTIAIIFALAAGIQSPQGPSAIRQVNFANFVYPWNESEGVPGSWAWMEFAPETVTLQGGRYAFVTPDISEDSAPYLALLRLVYGDVTGDGRDEALVQLHYGSGGSATWEYLYVYAIRDGSPALLGWLRGGSRGAGGLIGVSAKSSQLILTFNDPDKTAADCCSRGFVTLTYRFDQGRFVESGQERDDFEPTISTTYLAYRDSSRDWCAYQDESLFKELTAQTRTTATVVFNDDLVSAVRVETKPSGNSLGVSDDYDIDEGEEVRRMTRRWNFPESDQKVVQEFLMTREGPREESRSVSSLSGQQITAVAEIPARPIGTDLGDFAFYRLIESTRYRFDRWTEVCLPNVR
jgi:hypothetical protein